MSYSEFVPGSFMAAVVSYVEGPDKFYLQPLSRSDDLINLSTKMNLIYGGYISEIGDFSYSAEELVSAMKSTPEMVVAAPFYLQKASQGPVCYNRATIIDRPSPSIVKVFYVDYGNTADVPINSVKKLAQSLLLLPPMARLCRLTESITQVTNFCRLIDGYRVAVHVSKKQSEGQENPLTVSLYVTDGINDKNVVKILEDLENSDNSE